MKSFVSFLFRHFAFVLMAGIAIAVYALLQSNSGFYEKSRDSSWVQPSVRCTAWTTRISRESGTVSLEQGGSEPLTKGDRISTEKASAATVVWADGSVTRLAENTSISVRELESDSKTAKLNVEFSLEQGKTWTRIFRYLSPDSTFREVFDSGRKVAAVRGTAFEVNADKGYLRTQSHAVDVSKSSDGTLLATVPEGVALDFTNLQSIIQSSLDTAWRRMNEIEDLKMAEKFAIEARKEIESRLAGLPIGVELTASGVIIKPQGRLAEEIKDGKASYERLLRAYEAAAALPDTVENLKSKESLRKAILEIAPENRKSEIATAFALHETYDSRSESAQSGEMAEEIRRNIREYLKAGADKGAVDRLNEAIDRSGLDAVNDKIDALKKKGMDALSEPAIPLADEVIGKAAEKFSQDAKDAADAAKKIFGN